MKIQMLTPIAGLFHGHVDVKRGDVLEVDDESAVRYCALGYCEPHRGGGGKQAPVERAVPQSDTVETAKVEVPADLPKPLDEPEPESDDSAKEPAAQRKPSAAPNARRR